MTPFLLAIQFAVVAKQRPAAALLNSTASFLTPSMRSAIEFAAATWVPLTRTTGLSDRIKLGPANGREARESGLWPKARVAPGPTDSRSNLPTCRFDPKPDPRAKQIVKIVTETLMGSSVKLPRDQGATRIACRVVGSSSSAQTSVAVLPMSFAPREENLAHWYC
jgi:hypothetical protein